MITMAAVENHRTHNFSKFYNNDQKTFRVFPGKDINSSWVVFHNGRYMAHQMWETFAQHFNRLGLNVLTYDFINQGDHRSDPEQNTINQYAQYSLDLMNHLNIPTDRTIHIGLSFGAQILRELVTRMEMRFQYMYCLGLHPRTYDHAQMVNHELWLEAFEYGGVKAAGKLISQSIHSASQKNRNASALSGSISRIEEKYSHRPEAFKAITEVTYLDVKHNLLVPVEQERFFTNGIIIVGEEDVVSPRETMKYAQSKSIPVHVMENVGHMPIVDAPHETLGFIINNLFTQGLIVESRHKNRVMDS